MCPWVWKFQPQLWIADLNPDLHLNRQQMCKQKTEPEAVQPSEDTEVPQIRQQLRSSRYRKARTRKNIQTAKIQEKVQMVFSMALLQVKQWRRMEVLLR